MAENHNIRQWTLTVLRAVLGIIFLYHGYLKLFVPGGFAGTVGFFGLIGIPFPFFSSLIVSIVEFAGGLFLILGLLSKWASLLLIINMLVALFKVHLQNGFLVGNGGFEFAAVLIFGLAVILFNGPGSLSLDKEILGAEKKKKKSKKLTWKKVWNMDAKFLNDFNPMAIAAFRIFLGFTFAYHGFLRLFVEGNISGTILYLSQAGIPFPSFSAYALGIIEFTGGILLILGILSRLAAFLLLMEMLKVFFLVHLKNGFLVSNNGYEFALILIAALIFVLVNGAGKVTLADSFWNKHLQ